MYLFLLFLQVARFHCNGKYLATGSRDSTCRLWDIQSGNCVRLMTGGKSPITSLAFSPNGKQLVSGGESESTVIHEECIVSHGYTVCAVQ